MKKNDRQKEGQMERQHNIKKTKDHGRKERLRRTERKTESNT